MFPMLLWWIRAGMTKMVDSSGRGNDRDGGLLWILAGAGMTEMVGCCGFPGGSIHRGIRRRYLPPNHKRLRTRDKGLMIGDHVNK